MSSTKYFLACADLEAQLTALKQQCDEWEACASRQYSEITKLRGALEKIVAEYEKWGGQTGIYKIAKEALSSAGGE